MNFEKIYGAEQRQDGLKKIGRGKYEAQYGYGSDGENGWNYRKQYRGEKPSVETIKAEIFADLNESINKAILSGYKFDGVPVWLSSENQLNYKCAYDLAVQTSGASLPVTFKLGTDEEPVYKTFETLDELQAFYVGAVTYIQTALAEGWKEKDSFDWGLFECEE